MKKARFASARGSAILATLTEGISKLSGPRWVQKVNNLKSSRRNVSEIKLKRTDTTLDLMALLVIGLIWSMLSEVVDIPKPKGLESVSKKRCKP
jgi:hypothetical protein